MPKCSFEEFLDAAMKAGFEAVDVGIEPFVQAAREKSFSAAQDILGKRKLKALCFGASPVWQRDDAEFERTFAPFPEQAKIASRLGITRCITWIPPTTPLSFAERMDQIVPRLRRIQKTLEDSGIRFGVEFIGPKTLRKKDNEFIHTMEQGLALADALGPQAGLLVDSFHWYTSGATVADLDRVPVERIVHVHINDAPDRPVDEQVDGERLLPGEGVIDLKGFLGCLKRKGYPGAIAVETFSAELRKLSPDDAARKAKAALDRVLALS